MDAVTIIADATKRREAALAEAERWSSYIKLTCELYGLEPPVPSAVMFHAPPMPKAMPRAAAGTDFSGATLRLTQEKAIQAIREAGRPLHTRELLAMLAERGVEVGGKEPASTLSARLSRAPGLKNRRPYGWTLTESSEEDEAAEQSQASDSAAPTSTPHSADEDGREVVHVNTDLDDL